MSTAGTSPYVLLEPPLWRSLLARAAIFRSARAALARLTMATEGMQAVQLVLIELDLAARKLADLDCDDDTAVETLAREWLAVITQTIDGKPAGPDERQLLIELQTLVSAASVDDPFGELFEAVQAQAEALYGAGWRRSRLSVAHMLSHPRNADLAADPYAVTAMTPWPPDAQSAEVELRIFCDKFGPAAYAAVPMVLTHEFVCHVPAHQDKAKNDSDFAEGFLDWAAYYFLDQWASKIDAQLAPAARQHAERLKAVLERRPEAPEVHARAIGHMAARCLIAWLERDRGLSKDESIARVARLAVQLNLVDRPLDVKDHFVGLLSWQDPPPPLAEALRSWVADPTEAERLLEVM
ncbi:hypothetical protein AB0L64_40710 [Kribbella sp. NPDC051936]|uniref:hypothetical protein n=1 Tax=Kribbella sp. NPDC051936 TaxID=3154946 RepID=UPI0034141252